MPRTYQGIKYRCNLNSCILRPSIIFQLCLIALLKEISGFSAIMKYVIDNPKLNIIPGRIRKNNPTKVIKLIDKKANKIFNRGLKPSNM